MSLPTITLNEVTEGIQDKATNPLCKKILVGMLDDYMDLQYAKETPYTTGQRVIPAGVTIQEIDSAIANTSTQQKYKACFEKISEVEKSGNRTPQANDGTWDSKLTPILVLIKPNKT